METNNFEQLGILCDNICKMTDDENMITTLCLMIDDAGITEEVNEYLKDHQLDDIDDFFAWLLPTYEGRIVLDDGDPDLELEEQEENDENDKNEE